MCINDLDQHMQSCVYMRAHTNTHTTSDYINNTTNIKTRVCTHTHTHTSYIYSSHFVQLTIPQLVLIFLPFSWLQYVWHCTLILNIILNLSLCHSTQYGWQPWTAEAAAFFQIEREMTSIFQAKHNHVHL